MAALTVNVCCVCCELVCDRLQRELAALRQLWQSSQRQLKRIVIFRTIDVIQSWNVAQVRNIQPSIHIALQSGLTNLTMLGVAAVEVCTEVKVVIFDCRLHGWLRDS